MDAPVAFASKAALTLSMSDFVRNNGSLIKYHVKQAASKGLMCTMNHLCIACIADVCRKLPMYVMSC